MKSRWLWQVSVTTVPTAEEAVAALLERLFGRPASAFHDWQSGTATVSVFAEDAVRAGDTRLAGLRRGLAALRQAGAAPGGGRITCRRLAQQDWAESWKRHFGLMEFGKALRVRPGWIRRRLHPGQVEVVLDPGLSFGTGQHPTTGFCLRQLVRCRKGGQPQSFLDIGCGSGILAIAAAKLGYRPVKALDFDPEAVRIARANARRNRVERRVALFRADLARLPLRSRTRYNVVCANLISPLLLAEGRRLVNRLKPGGRLVLAGILRREFPALREHYCRLGLEYAGGCREKEWHSGVFVRP